MARWFSMSSFLVVVLLAFGLWGWADSTAFAAGSDWTTYGYNLGGTGDNVGETTLNASNVARLHPSWVAHGAGGMSAQPIVVGNVAYWGTWDGVLHATAIAGAGAGRNLWTRPLGVTHRTGCSPGTAAMAGTPTYGLIGSTPTLFVADGGNNAVGGGNVVMYAINATNGTVEWHTAIAPVAPDTFAWSSPILYNGSVYYSLSSLADCPVIRGRVVKLSATTGAVQNTFFTGSGVWGTPSIDIGTGRMYVPVGSPAPRGAGGFDTALVELNASNLSLVASWSVPAGQRTSDGDFGSVPTLFAGGGRQLVGVGGKNGIFYAWDRTNIAAGPVWQRQVAVGGGNPQGGQGTLSPANWDGSTLYVAGGTTTIRGVRCAGSVRALNPATGTSKWEYCAPGHILGSLAMVPSVVVAAAGSSIVAVNAATGAQLFRYTQPSGRVFWGAPSIGSGHVFAGNMDASVTALGL